MKFGGGFYCGKLPTALTGGEDVYVINGFYMAMRGQVGVVCQVVVGRFIRKKPVIL